MEPAVEWRLLTGAAPVRLRWRVLVVLYCPLELLLARVLLGLTMAFGLVTLYPAVGFYLAYAAVIGFFVAGLLMPHARRHQHSRVAQSS